MAPTPAKDLAATIRDALGVDLTVPNTDLTATEFQLPDQTGPLYTQPAQMTLEDLTEGVVNGAGAFDKIMASHKVHLKDQKDAGLITGDQYTKAYIELTSLAMQAALQFLTARDQGYWQALLAQAQARRAEIEAVTAAVQLETAKHQLAAAMQQSKVFEAQYVLTLMQTASEDARYQLLHGQIEMTAEQTEAQRAQTMDTRTDGITPVAGNMGKQKELYAQQITSYQRDGEAKVAKMYVDGFITQKTLDEGLTPPAEMQAAIINEVLNKLRTNVGLTSTP